MNAQIVDANFVQSHIGKLPIIDVRPAEMYDEGHIPTAVNIPLDDYESFGDREGEELSKAYRKHAFDPDDAMIIYCRTGRHAKMACDYLVPQGYNKLYLYSGSFADWSSDPSRPIEK